MPRIYRLPLPVFLVTIACFFLAYDSISWDGITDINNLMEGGVFQQPTEVNISSKDLHPTDITLYNITNFTFPINHHICNVADIAIVTTIHTAVQNREARDAIRATWGNPGIPGINTRLVFLLGLPEDASMQVEVEKEAEYYQDIVQGGFIDTYHNLSYKNLMGKLWVGRYCEQAEFVVKADDDWFVDLFAFYTYSRGLLQLPEYKSDSFFWCPVWVGMPILRDNTSKWYVSYDDIPKEENSYPRYCTGCFSVYSPRTGKRLADVAPRVKFLWVDDVWVTGYIARELGIQHISSFDFFTLNLENMLVLSAAQSSHLYHKFNMVAPFLRQYEVAKVLQVYSERCYREKCFNKIYHPDTNITEDDVLLDVVMKKFITFLEI